ncbi:MAG TPA: hypothetical protein VGB10_06515, partial [Bacteroidota bacterium]
HSSKIKEARSRAEAASFREATADNSASAFREFLAEYPQSVFTLKAKDRYESLLYAKAVQENSAEAAAEYLKEFPNGRYAPVMKQRTSSANEDELYTAAVNESRSPVYRYYAYRRYVRAYPKGKYDEIVRRDLAAQKLEATRPFGETSWLDNFDRGVQAMEAGRNEEAAARFLRAIEQREQDSENILLTDGRRVNYLPHRELGICLIELGVTDFAKVELQLSISYIWTLRTQEALNRL